MQSFHSIRILESENNKKGDLFARLMRDLFISLGYGELHFNVHKTGREIDILGSHRLENRYFVAECKAVKNAIGGDDINKFVGVFEAEKLKNPDKHPTAYFISLSGFTEAAIEQERDLEFKRVIFLEGNDIIRELIRGNAIVSLETAIEKAGRCASDISDNLKPETNCELLAVHNMGWIWVVYFEENKKKTHFALIHSSGEFISADLAQEIIEKDKTLKGSLHLLNYLPPKFQASISQTRIEETKAKYFEYLANECGEITLEGLPADQDVGSRRLRLENIFVPLHLEKEYPIDYDASINIAVKKNERQTVGRVFTDNSRIAILAAPGGGKTTLLKRLAVAYAFPDRRKMINDDLPERDLLPLFIRCRQLGDLINSSINDILRTIPKKFEQDDLENEFFYIINTSLQKGNTLLLIDGLDEISDEGYRISFVKKLRIFLSYYPNIKVVITSREAGFRIISGVLCNFFQTYRIADLTDYDIERLTIAWNIEVVGNRPEIFSESKKLANTICNSDRVRQLAKNPLLLTTLLLVNRWVGQLPTKRSVLYGKAIEVLLMTWNVEGHESIDPEEAIPQLSFIAFSMMAEGVQRISSRRFKELLDIARKQMPEVLGYARISSADFIKRVELRSSLLILTGHEIEQGTLYPMYEFQHLTFQEYLTARAIVGGYYPDRTDDDTILDILKPYLKNQQWKEVVPLTAVLADRGAQPLVEYLVHLCKYLPKKGLKSSEVTTPLSLLGQCIIDEVKITPNLLEESFEWLSKKSTPTYILSEISRGKFGKKYKEVVQKVYMQLNGELFNLSEALLTSTGIEFENISEHKFNTWLFLNDETYNKIKLLLVSENIYEKASGAALVSLAAYTSVYAEGNEYFVKVKDKLKALGKEIIPLLYSDDARLHFQACWAYSWLGRAGIWSPEDDPNIISRMLSIWMDSNLEEVKFVAAWAISELPIVNRNACILPEPNIQSIDFVKNNFLEERTGYYKTSKLACLIIGLYWKTPWNDEEILKFTIDIYKNKVTERTKTEQLFNSLGESGKIALEWLKKKNVQ